jgi:hypothetical protein
MLSFGNSLRWWNLPRKAVYRPSLDTTILYVIAYETTAKPAVFTPFRGFQLPSASTSDLLQIVAAMPSDVRQFAYETDSSVNNRAVGFQPLRFVYCPIRHLRVALDHLHPQFSVILCDHHLAGAVAEHLQNVSWSPIESIRNVFRRTPKTGENIGNTICLLRLPVEKGGFSTVAGVIPNLLRVVHSYVREVVKELSRSDQPNIAGAFSTLAITDQPHRRASSAEWEALPIRSLLPTHTVLSSMGFDLRPGPGLRSVNNAPYFDAIFQGAEQILLERANLFQATGGPLIRTTNDILLLAPTLFCELQLTLERGLAWARSAGVPLDNHDFRQFLNIISREKGFLFGAMLMREEAEFIQSATAKMFLSLYITEGRVVSAFSSVIAADSQAPALHWAPDVAETYEPVAEFARLRRVPTEKPTLISTSAAQTDHVDAEANRQVMMRFANCQEHLARVTPPQYVDLLRRPGSAKIISDLPLEWLDIDGLPLMLARETSRLPITPGMLLQSIPTPEPLYLPIAACRKVLVLTSFDESKGAHSKLVELIRDANLTFVKPVVKVARRPKDVIDALNKFDGPLVVFDMHGQPGNDLIGELVLAGNARFSPYREIVISTEGMWVRGSKVRIPPLVLLSACDTLAIDSPSGSAAYGFLLAGAYAVVATFLPISMFEAALFVGRLLRRYDEFLAKFSGRSHPVRWRQLVWDTQRLQHLLELFQGVHVAMEDAAYDAAWGPRWLEFGVKTGDVINGDDPRFPGDRSWYDCALGLLTEIFSISRDEVLAIIRDRVRFTDAMNYVQVGFPERVVIMTNPFEKMLPHLAQNQWTEAFPYANGTNG